MNERQPAPARPRIALAEGRATSFGQLAARYLQEYLDKIGMAVEPLTDEQVWWRPHRGANSIANLMLHLEGNLSLWILAGIGGHSYQRDRQREFAVRGDIERSALMERLTRCTTKAWRIVAGLTPSGLQEEVSIQGYEADVRGAVFHAVEHMSYHTGQIVWIAKQLRGEVAPLDFYPQHRAE